MGSGHFRSRVISLPSTWCRIFPLPPPQFSNLQYKAIDLKRVQNWYTLDDGVLTSGLVVYIYKYAAIQCERVSIFKSTVNKKISSARHSRNARPGTRTFRSVLQVNWTILSNGRVDRHICRIEGSGHTGYISPDISPPGQNLLPFYMVYDISLFHHHHPPSYSIKRSTVVM